MAPSTTNVTINYILLLRGFQLSGRTVDRADNVSAAKAICFAHTLTTTCIENAHSYRVDSDRDNSAHHGKSANTKSATVGVPQKAITLSGFLSFGIYEHDR